MTRRFAPASAPASSIRSAWSSAPRPGGRGMWPGDFDAAIDHCRNTIDMDPEFMPPAACSPRRISRPDVTAEALCGARVRRVAGRWRFRSRRCSPALAHAKAVTGNRRDAVALIARARALDQRAIRVAVPSGDGATSGSTSLDDRVRDARSGVARSRSGGRRRPRRAAVRADPWRSAISASCSRD